MDIKKDIDYLMARAAELLSEGKEWSGYEVDPVEWTDAKYYHQN